MYRCYLALLLSLPLVGCQLRPTLPGDAVYQRGLFSLEAEGGLFQACGRTRWQPMSVVSDPLRREYLRISNGREGLPVYIEGWGEERNGVWQVIEPRVIGGDLTSCEEDFSGVELYAVGMEPPWSVMLSSEKLVFNEPGRLRSLVFAEPDWIREGNIWRWYQSLKGRKSRIDIVLEVVLQPCRDARGNWYALHAEVDLEGSLFSGCARYGDLHRLKLATHYRTPVGEYLRDIHLLLKEDGSARLVRDNNDGQPLVPRVGHWRFLNRERILLELERPDAAGMIDTQLWQLTGDGRLALLNDDPALGRGLQLQSVGRVLQWPETGRMRLP